MKKKYLVVTLVTILILTIGVSFAYIRGIIVAKNKSNISLKVKELYILFKDVTEISEKNINFGWEETKSFSIENQGDTTFYYNIIIEDLINTLESDGLQYKINSSNGYDMKEFKSVPKQTEKGNVILAHNLEIKGGETKEYRVTFKYVEDPVLDQSGDMGKTFSGKLGITEGIEPKTLTERILEDNVLKGTRTNFENILPYSNPIYSGDNYIGDDYDKSKDTESGLYKEENLLFTEDTSGDGIGEVVYYFAGNVQNNWVKFADFYWRIVRTNEDGGVRLLYAGDSLDTESAYVGITAFNLDSQDPMYAGYKYGESGSLENNRLNTHNSTILGSDEGTDEGTLNWWYVNEILKGSDGTNSYDDYVSKTAIYCNDRAVNPNVGEYATDNYFEYLAVNRGESSYRPSFKCGVDASGSVIEETQNVADKFSADKSSGGNGQLKYPIGLMTSDEVVYAGGSILKDNKNIYYYTNSLGYSVTGIYYWWLLSPGGFDGAQVGGRYVIGQPNPGTLSGYYTYWPHGVRPVISLKSCVTVSSGNGTSDTPYEFSIDSSCAEAVN